MKIKNRYYQRSRITEAKFRQLIRCFALDLTASNTAELIGLSVRSTNSIFIKIRHRIAEFCEIESPLQGAVEVDESYFGAQRVRGKRGRGAYGKTIVFGLLKRQGKVYTEIVPDCSKQTLQGIIRGHVDPGSVIHSDGWRGYEGLVDIGHDKHFRVNHGANEFADGERHINGIESFWSYAKRRLAKFNGVAKHTFYFHLKETEYRFNHRHDNLYLKLLKLLRNNPL
ncbi:IS1595 family transposase [Acinetobacter bouvetii]|uniref:ISXO2-like transposase domain protein n=1 Tax=Acinetobacter bouvetii TaxID=202951 RepID=A0A811G711_9GAMM|nr:IS1595 family transposase [Acinetobacter bouvetii]CAB1209899.1 ISXO2-like transposase domain protein [Acinetobacter bouvetii]